MPRTLAAIVLAIGLLSGCSKPVPELRAEYIGHWRGAGIEMTISADGLLAYRRSGKGRNVSINAPITGFKGNDFTVGLWFMTTTFEVSEPPHQVEDRWQMVVDGVRLTRTDKVPGTRPQGEGPTKFICSDCWPHHAA